jgi:hypothetical protein
LFDVGDLDPAVLAAIEADSFWCLSKLLDGIQDNYINQQPGIQRLVKRMSELVKRIDGEPSDILLEASRLWNSTPRCSFRGSRYRIHAVRIQVDELFVDAGNQYEVYSQNVGYLSRMSSSSRGHLSLTIQRQKAQMRSPNSTSTCALHYLSSFPSVYEIWTSK